MQLTPRLILLASQSFYHLNPITTTLPLTADSCFLALLISLSHTLSTFLLRLIDFRQSPHPSPIPLTKRHRTPRPAVPPRIYHVQLVRKRRYNPISSRKQILCRLCPRRIFRYNTTTLSYRIIEYPVLRRIADLRTGSHHGYGISVLLQRSRMCKSINPPSPYRL